MPYWVSFVSIEERIADSSQNQALSSAVKFIENLYADSNARGVGVFSDPEMRLNKGF